MSFRDLTDGVLAACMSTIGELVSYTPLVGSTTSVQAIFNVKSYEVDPGSGVPVETHRPTLGVKLNTLLTAPKRGDQVVVRGIAYRVIDVDDDGEGGSVLSLQKA